MKITEIITYVLSLGFRFKIGAMPPLQASGLFINLKTDENIDGWGLSHWNLSNNAQKVFIDEALSKLVINKDPFMVEEIYSQIYNSSNRILFGVSPATSAIEVALWDIIGKKTNQPIYRLLGGMKKKFELMPQCPEVIGLKLQ